MIFDRILAHKMTEVAAARQAVGLEELRHRCRELGPTRRFEAALRKAAADGTAIIAEVKKGSPSKGIIRKDFDPEAIAEAYEKAGAACLSVLTDRDFFHGELAFLGRIRQKVSVPLLRKDFLVDPYQVYEARAAGADAVLLIAAALGLSQLQEMAALAGELGLDVLLEVHDETELELALQTPVGLIGINNRNLQTFQTDLAITERLIPKIPADRLVVSESGIRDRSDIRRLLDAGAGAFLVGESLMREADVGGKLLELLQD
jgi:indole-3-glycerol phosphate synthase